MIASDINSDKVGPDMSLEQLAGNYSQFLSTPSAGKTNPKINNVKDTCNYCGKPGHYERDCRSTTRVKIRTKTSPTLRVVVVEAKGTVKEAVAVGGSLTIPLHKTNPRKKNLPEIRQCQSRTPKYRRKPSLTYANASSLEKLNSKWIVLSSRSKWDHGIPRVGVIYRAIYRACSMGTLAMVRNLVIPLRSTREHNPSGV